MFALCSLFLLQTRMESRPQFQDALSAVKTDRPIIGTSRFKNRRMILLFEETCVY